MSSDLDLPDNDISAEPKRSGKPSTTANSPDYEAKFKGLSKKYDQERRNSAALQERLDNRDAEHEESLGTERLEKNAFSKQLEEANKFKSSFEAEREKLTRELNQTKSRLDSSNKIYTDYPDLVGLFAAGDLKDPESFDSPEAYDAYLQRQQSYLAPAQTPKRSVAGAVPPTPTRAKEPQAAHRSSTEIRDEMWNIDTRTSAGQARYDELMNEQDQARQREKGIK